MDSTIFLLGLLVVSGILGIILGYILIKFILWKRDSKVDVEARILLKELQKEQDNDR